MDVSLTTTRHARHEPLAAIGDVTYELQHLPCCRGTADAGRHLQITSRGEHVNYPRRPCLHLCTKDTPSVEYSVMLRGILVKSKEAPAGTGDSLAERNYIADYDYLSVAKSAVDFWNGKTAS